MLKELFIVRHAKSTWEFNVKDDQRPLTEKGIKRAEKMAFLLKDTLEEPPTWWQTSPAARALHTSMIFAKTFGKIPQLKIHPEQYTFSPQQLLEIVHTLPQNHHSAILFGHNDAIHQLVNQLGSVFVNKFGTANVAHLQFEVKDWSEISKGTTVKIYDSSVIQ